MCVEHQGLRAEEVRRISPVVPGLGLQKTPEISGISAEAKVSAGRISGGTILPPASPLVGRKRSGFEVDKEKVASAMVVEKDIATGSVEKIGGGVKKEALAAVAEDPKKTALLALLTRIDTMQANNTIPGKKQSEKQLWITTQLAKALGVIIPMNADQNFGKSEGFRRNIFKRVQQAAKALLGAEYTEETLPEFMR